MTDRDGSSAKVDDLDEVRMADLLPSVVMVASMDRVDSAGGHRIALIVCRVKHRVRPSGGGVFCIHRTEVDSGRTTFGCPSVVPVSRCPGVPEGRRAGGPPGDLFSAPRHPPRWPRAGCAGASVHRLEGFIDHESSDTERDDFRCSPCIEADPQAPK